MRRYTKPTNAWVETAPGDAWFDATSTFSGSAHSVDCDVPVEEPDAAVRRVAEEVTGKTFTRVRRFGFI